MKLARVFSPGLLVNIQIPFILLVYLDFRFRLSSTGCYVTWKYLAHSSISSPNGEYRENDRIFGNLRFVANIRGPGLAAARHSTLTPVKLSSQL
ncbi:hypothetical protein AVEN_49156-1 [Araneus ventricosus]|uniref:Uncharacterized protein n=1 Tax=Araneus ventricosus TaxID=182803 RepID=A0A4Y2C2T1_ARAVE|nr:hypothetical protein AVEN_49156-1 [Araneus ventricosus]